MSQLVRLGRPPAPSMLSRVKAALQAVRSSWNGPFGSGDRELARKLYGDGYESSSGIVVTEQNAMTFSAVFSAVLQISADVAKLPLNLHKRRKEGGSDHYVDSRLYHLLKNEPNPETSSMMFRQTLTAHALTCHGGYAEIERNMHGQPAAIWTLTPDRVEPFRRDQFDRATGRKTLGPLEYRIDGNDDQILPMRDVIHISGLGYDGITGYAVINKARQAIGLALAMEKFSGHHFGKGTIFGGHISSDVDLDEDQKKDIKDNIEAFRKAQDSAWRLLVTGAGTKFTQFKSGQSESQMDSTKQVLEVARFFRMPPVKLGVNTPGTVSYASSEQADLDYYKGAMLDWITREEQEFNRKLIPASERRQQFIKHNATAFLRADTAGRTTFYKTMLTEGVFCADDVLELEDLNPQPNGQGKLYLVQGAMISKQQLVELTAAKIKKLNEPKPAPVAPAPSDQQTSGDQDRAITQLAEQMTQIGAAVTALGGDQQSRLDEMRDELEAVRAAQAHAVADLANATRAADALIAERDAAIARATEAAETAAAATTDRDAMGAAASQASAEASAASQAVVSAEAARQAALADQTAAGERLAELQGRFDALTSELETARTALQASEEASSRAAAAHQAAETDAAAERATEVASLTSARDEAAAAAETLRTQLTALEASHAANLSQRDHDIEGVRQQLAAAQSLLGQTDQERTARIAALSADTERLAAELASREAAAAAARQQEAEERAGLAAAAEAAEAGRVAMEVRVAELEARSADAEAAALRAQQQIEGERTARIERMTATIAAHRGLIVDAIGRMARRGCQQARSKQATPEKVRRWLEGYLTAEAPICVEALLPVMRVRLAAQASTADPVAATVAIVTEHLAAFEALIRGALDAPAEDFHAELERVLARWETERAERVADALLEQEIRHVRAL